MGSADHLELPTDSWATGFKVENLIEGFENTSRGLASDIPMVTNCPDYARLDLDVIGFRIVSGGTYDDRFDPTITPEAAYGFLDCDSGA